MPESIRIEENELWKKTIDILFFCAVLTSSFDIFLTIDFFGFNLRITQLFQGLLICMALLELLKTKILYLPKGFVFLVLFTICNLLCTFHTILPMWNITYNIWLILFVMVVWAIYVLYKDRTARMMELYLLSFYVMAVWGCIQFILGFSGISDWMITQWWIDGFPRVNGFTYEPSYYSTYLIMGYMIVQTSCLFGINKIGKLHLRPLCYISTVALVLCSSRMVYIPIGCMLMFSATVILFQIKEKNISIKNGVIELGKQGVVLVILFMYFCTMQFVLNKQVPPAPEHPGENQEHMIEGNKEPEKASDILLRNVGAEGDRTNVNWRLKGWKASWNLYLTSPFYGYGLGGISAEAMRAEGMTINEMKTLGRGASTGNVFLEILAATGLIGTLFFLGYGWQLVSPSLSWWKKGNSKDFIELALVVALIGECIMLAMNQNILRNYAWLHVAVLSCYVSKEVGKGWQIMGRGKR